MAHFITTHGADGKTVFSNKTATKQNEFPIPLGSMTILYSTHKFPESLDKEQDLEQYARDREAGFGPGVACPPGGTCGSILRLAPGLKSPMRKLATIGVFYVLEGEVTLHLDGGETKVFRTGDSGVLRGAMHSWENTTKESARLISFSQSIADV